MTTTLLRADGISVRRGDRLVVHPCDISIRPGERVAIYGPNGAGKSTLLQALAGLCPVASGLVAFQGRLLGQRMPLLEFHRRTATVFQQPLLLRGSVRHNAELGLKLRGVPRAERQARIQPWLQRLDIAHLAERPAGGLSGGEAQRTNLARALALEPEVLFLDEPFAALDAPTRARLAGELLTVFEERRIAAVFVTHDIEEAAQLCDRCVVVDGGRVQQQDDIDVVLDCPASRRVAEITGATNLFEGMVVAVQADCVWIDWNGQRLLARGAARVGSDVGFMLRRAQIHLSRTGAEARNQIRGRVEHVRRRSGGSVLGVRLSNGCELRCDSAERVMQTEETFVSFSPDAVWIFPEIASGTISGYARKAA